MEPIYTTDLIEAGAAVLTIDEIKRHLRLTDTDAEDNSDLMQLEADARDYIESRCGLYLSPTRLEMKSNRVWCDGRLYLKSVPALSIQSVQIRDNANSGVYRTLVLDVDYKAALSGLRPHLYPVGMGWLAFNFGPPYPDFWKVDFTAGYATGACPNKFKRAIKLLIGHWYWTREVVADTTQNEIPQGLQRILDLGYTGEL